MARSRVVTYHNANGIASDISISRRGACASSVYGGYNGRRQQRIDAELSMSLFSYATCRVVGVGVRRGGLIER